MKRQLDRQEGQQIIQFALLLPVLLACLGLVIDVGNAYAHRRMVQNAADAAATAAGMILYEQGNSPAITTAYWYAIQYGYDNDGASNTVQVTTPPNCIQVDVQENVVPIFVAIVWNGTFNVRGHAKACFAITALGPSVIVLEEDACETLTLNGNNAAINVWNGNIHVNSHCSNAVDLGNGDITTLSAVSIVGNWVGGPNGHFYDTGGQPLAPLTGQPVLPDPLANLPAPNLSSYATRYGTAAQPNTLKITHGNVTLNPGVYYGGINITGGNVTFNPGVYIMAGSGLSVTGNADVEGEEVFFYLTHDPANPSGAGAAGSLDLSGNGDLELTPPSSGTYAGVTFFQARDNTEEGHIHGTSDTELSGVIYMPEAHLGLTGNSTMEANFVVNTLSLDGNPDLNVEGWEGDVWTTVTDVLTE